MFVSAPESAWRFFNFIVLTMVACCRLFWLTIDLTMVGGSFWDFGGFWATIGSHHFIFHFILPAHHLSQWSETHQMQLVQYFIFLQKQPEESHNFTVLNISPAEISTHESGDFPRFRSPLSQKTFRWWIVQICQKYLMCWSPPGRLTTPWQADWCLWPSLQDWVFHADSLHKWGLHSDPPTGDKHPPPPGGNKRLGPNFCSLSTMPVIINPLPNQQLYQCNLNTC